ncbi:MAG: ABC transporter permease [Chloroflexi bacterium]|nr:ABC transporter permease [Chloroflexota bacterium]
MSRGVRWGGPLAAGLAFVLAWQAIVWLGDYPEYVLPGPFVVAARFGAAWADGTMADHFLATLASVVGGFALGALVGLPAGYLLARSPVAQRVLSPYFVAAEATPILALAPLIFLWFGSGLGARVIVCALVVFFPVLISTMVAIRGVDRRLLEMGQAFRATRRQEIALIEVPAAMPGIMGGLRIGVTLAVVGAIVAEWAGGEKGLGVLINLARGSLFDIPLMFAALLTIALLGVACYTLVLGIERLLVGARQ